MTIRNLKFLFEPESIALIGASTKPGSVGRVLAQNLFNSGFQGPVMPVHPKHRAVEGVLTYPGVAELPLVPDLAVIATPPDTIPGLIAELGEHGTRAAVVITAGVGAGGTEGGRNLRQEMLDASRPYTLRIVGPNCLGLLLPGQGVNASFSHIAPKDGDLAFITQSGAMVTSMLDWAAPRGIGFSKVVSLGDMADADFGDLLDYLALDRRTRAILLYIETITDARKFMSAARVAARIKPVIVIKGGRFAEGARAAASHTGALAGSDAVFDAAFRRAGMLRATTLAELFEAAETLSQGLKVPGDRLAILTNGGGLGVLATDALIELGGRLAELSDETIARLDGVLPPTWSRNNPVDIIGDAPGARYAAALEALIEDRNADAILVLNCPTAVADPLDAAEAVVETVERKRFPVFASWLGDSAARPGREKLTENGIANYRTPEAAVSAFMHLVQYRRNQEMLMETPASLPDLFERQAGMAAEAIQAALADGREWLSEAEVRTVLAAYGIPTVPSRTAATPEEAAEAAGALGFPVVLKIQSPDITHKSDVTGVLLELENRNAVRDAAEGMLARLARLMPEARLTGFTVQQMVERKGAFELILGIGQDALFGPVILFGQGGTAVEVVKDRALALPPLNINLARRLMAETRVHRLLSGYRDRPPAALAEIELVLVKLSQLAADQAELLELDINPLLADSKGITVLDARVRVAHAKGPAQARLAIRPYPSELEQRLVLDDGVEIALRPIRPEDEPALRAGFEKLSPSDVRMRFFAPLKELDHRLASRLSQIDYTREMAFVAYDPEAGDGDFWGVVRINSDPDGTRAEFAVVVRSDIKRRGLGRTLLEQIIAYSRDQGIAEIWGTVLAENKPMLALAQKLGFSVAAEPEDPTVMKVVLDLTRDRPAALPN